VRITLGYGPAVTGLDSDVDETVEVEDGKAQQLLRDGYARRADDEAPGAYNPDDHTVEEVLAHLDTVDADERDRIMAAEVAGKNRKGITDTDLKG
jgi:hypothetical protein